MTVRHQLSRVLLLLCVFANAGCATGEVQRYVAHDREAAAESDVAYLHVSDKIMVNEIDGEGRYYPLLDAFGSRYQGAIIELLPGEHSANVIYHQQYGHTSKETALPFEVDAGGHYEIQTSFTQVNYSPKIAFEVVVWSKSSSAAKD